MEGSTSVLIIDDDPMHLKIYGWIVGSVGYEALTALVTGSRIEFPEQRIDLVIMDYRLSSGLSAVEAAEAVRTRVPGAPIVVLSDLYDLPADIAPYATAFVRKGEPAKLVETLERILRGTKTVQGGAGS